MSGFIREHVVKRLTRSSKWPRIRKEHLKRQPECQSCGNKRFSGMQVHHIVPFHVAPHLELDGSNLLTLCDNPRCHLDKGHLGYFKSHNVNVIEDCKIWRRKYETRP